MFDKISLSGVSNTEWLRLRKSGIGGSDAGAICGVNPYSSAMKVFKDKTGEEIEEEDVAAEHFYFYLNLGALVLYVFCSFLPIISRIGYYLTVSHILYLPMLLRQIRDAKWRRVFRMGILSVAILYFMIYMSRAGNDGTLILPYKTFFFHDMVNILSDVN